MQLKTPKRYRKQRRRVFSSWNWLRNVFLIVMFSYVGYWVYNNQTRVRERFEDFRSEANTQVQGLQTAIPRQPTATPDVTNELAEANAAYQSGDFQRAINSYRLAMGGLPNDLEAHYRLALLLTITSDFGENKAQLEEANEIADEAINANPEAPEGWSIKAMTLVWSEQYGEAIAYAQRALEIDPDYVQAKAYLAQAYYRLDNTDLAISTIDEAIEYLRSVGSASSETIAAVFRTKGFIADRELEREEAIAAYEVARKAAPSHSYISLELATSYFGNGQTTEAIAMLTQALDANPRDTSILFQLGSIYIYEGNREDALGAFQRCIDVDATFAPCLSLLGGLQFFAGNYSQATSNLEQAIEHGSEDLEDWYQLGWSHIYLQRCDLAIPILREGYAKAEASPDMQDRIGSGLRECGINPNQVEAPVQPVPLDSTPSDFFTATPSETPEPEGTPAQ